MKKLLSAALVLVMMFTLIPLGAVAASAETTSGTTGDCTWTLANGVLTISGNGAMGDYEYGECPWSDSISEIKTLTIESGVTHIGSYSFCRNSGLFYVYFPETVKSIGEYAFMCSWNLASVSLPYSLKRIDALAFSCCDDLDNVYYYGTKIDREGLIIDDTIERGNNNYEIESAVWHYIAHETLVQTGIDEWSYVVNGRTRDHTTLVKYKDKWFYIKNGIWDKTANMLFAYKGKGFYIKNGKWAKETTLVKHNGGYSYVKGGIWTKATTLVKYKDKWFYIKNGVWKKDKLIFKYNGKKFYIDDGKVQFTYTGKVKVDGMYYNVKKGKVV